MASETPEKFKAFENNFSKIDIAALGMTKDDDGKLITSFYPAVMADGVHAPSAMKILLQNFYGSTVVLPIMVEVGGGESLENEIMKHLGAVLKNKFGEDLYTQYCQSELEMPDECLEKISFILENTTKEISLRIKPFWDVEYQRLNNKVVDRSELDGEALIYHSTTLAALCVMTQDGVVVMNGDTIIVEAFLGTSERCLSINDFLNNVSKKEYDE
ncbi:hypothetical protein [Photobacterium damselae]|uniref:hypothetical protein n=1 Tax=Photobacterium damselae TaxID=38293 RepID=UPI004068E842